MNCEGRIGIYGGTFDPIHFGHLNLAIQILEAHRLAEIWFCPVHINPHKVGIDAASSHHRLQMLRLALEGVPHCKITEIELHREGPSYTVDTLRALMAAEKQSPSPRQFCLILGDDAIPSFFRWHQPEEVVKMVPLLVGRRTLDPPKLEGDPAICEAIRRGITPTRIFEVSGTEIRQRIKSGLYCGHLVPAKVMDYIYANHIY